MIAFTDGFFLASQIDETEAARIRRYQTFAQQAYGVRPAPDTVRVVRLLAILERGTPAVALGPALEATFRRQQERWAVLQQTDRY